MLVIRLQKIGKKNQPAYKVVVTDKRNSAKAGVPVEQIGFVNTLTKEKAINKERALHWISVGAKASPTVFNVLVDLGIVQSPKMKIPVSKTKNPEKRVAQAKKKEESKAKKAEPKVEEVKEEEPKVEEVKTEEEKAA